MISIDITYTKNFTRTFSVLLKDLQGNVIDMDTKIVGTGATETVSLSSGTEPSGYQYIYIVESGSTLYYELVYKN